MREKFFNNLPSYNKNESGKERETDLEQKRENVEILLQSLKKVAADLKKIGIPVSEIDCRLSAEKNDQSYIEQARKKFSFRPENIYVDQYTYGELLEMIVIVIFHLCLANIKIKGQRVFCFGASAKDDVINKVDTLIVFEKNGETVCAIDEVTAFTPNSVTEKMDKVAEKNRQKNNQIESGLKFDGLGKAYITRLFNKPIFFRSLAPQQIEDAMKSLSEPDQPSDTIKKFFAIFVNLLNIETKALQIEIKHHPDRFSEIFQNNMNKFKPMLKKLENKAKKFQNY